MKFKLKTSFVFARIRTPSPVEVSKGVIQEGRTSQEQGMYLVPLAGDTAGVDALLAVELH